MAGWLLRICLRRGDAFVGMGGRHLDVDDRDVGAGELDPTQQLLSGLGLPDDREPSVGEKARQPLPHDHRVIGDDYAHGISAWSLTPPLDARSTPRRPSRAPIRS